MARTAIINKNQIIQAAFSIAKTSGRDEISIRKISIVLGISTGPIYTQYKGIDAINEDLVIYVNKKLIEYTLRERQISPFLTMGVGYLDFVIENKLIFYDFFLSMDSSIIDQRENIDLYIKQMKDNKFMSFFNNNQQKSILFDMTVYTHGLAVMICTTKVKTFDLNHYQKLLEQAGDKLIKYHLYSSGGFELVMRDLQN